MMGHQKPQEPAGAPENPSRGSRDTETPPKPAETRTAPHAHNRKDPAMGWNSANQIFNPVARALIDTGANDTTKRRVLGDLIGGLQDGDWDTEDESLEEFLNDPAVVAAFADHDVHLSDRRCCRAVLKDDPRALLLAMRHEDVAEPEMKQAINALARHLAQQIRTDADLRSAEGNRELGIYGRELADLITPKNSRDW